MEPDSQSPSVYLPHAPCYRRFSKTYRSMGTVDSLLMLVMGALAGFVIAAPVGPVGVLCIQRTLQEGRLSGLSSGLGAAFADAFYGCIAAFGLSLVSHWLESHELIFRLGGGLFLLFMASRMLRVALQPTPETIMPVLRHESLPGHFMSTFLLTATNPTTILAFRSEERRVGNECVRTFRIRW